MAFVAKERLYITPDGKVLREDEMDENTVASLLCGEGCDLSDAEARKYGLLDEKKAKAEPDEDKAVRAALANKARR